MRTQAVVFSLLLVILLGVPPAMAEWKGKAEAGVVLARGNTETTTANGKLDVANELEKWKHSALLAAYMDAPYCRAQILVLDYG